MTTLPNELIDRITELAGQPGTRDYMNLSGPRMCGQLTDAAGDYCKPLKTISLWRLMRHTAGLPSSTHHVDSIKLAHHWYMMSLTGRRRQKARRQPGFDGRLLQTSDWNVQRSGLTGELRTFDGGERVYTFMDKQGRYCLYNSLYASISSFGSVRALQEWLEAYSMWHDRVECYTRDPDSEDHYTQQGWPIRYWTFILRLKT